MLNIGILGAANVAKYALIEPAHKRDDVKLFAVASRDMDKASAYAGEQGIADAMDDYDALIARDDIDLIYNALPPSRHADLSIAALKSGKHVLCEKPFAMNGDEAEAMVAAAREAGRHLIEAFHYRHHPAFERVLEILASGKMGAVQHIEGVFNVAISPDPGELRYDPELGGGALMDLGCYPLHATRTVAGQEPNIIAAEKERGPTGVDVHTKADMAFRSGITATISCDMRPGTDWKTYIEIFCQNGSVYLHNMVAPQKGHHVRTIIGGDTTDETKEEDKTTYDYQLQHVVDVLSGKAEALTGGADAIGNMRAIDAIYAA